MTLPQVVYWGRWIGVGLSGPWPPAGPRIYSQRIRLGLLEIRIFAPRPPAARPITCPSCGRSQIWVDDSDLTYRTTEAGEVIPGEARISCTCRTCYHSFDVVATDFTIAE